MDLGLAFEAKVGEKKLTQLAPSAFKAFVISLGSLGKALASDIFVSKKLLFQSSKKP